MGLPNLVMLGVSFGASYLTSKLAGRQKLTPVDRGRLDDIRLNANGYGEFIPRVYGKARVAGMLIDATNITHTTTTTPGHGGGKGAPKPPTPDTINHVYTTTLDFAVCDGLGSIAPNMAVTRIWQDVTTIYDTSIKTQGDNLYEAERPGNTLAGGAVTQSDTSASGGTTVNLPVNGSCQWNGIYGTGATATLEFYYASTAANSVQFVWTGTGTSTFTDTLHNTGGAYTVYRSAPFSLASGFVNTLKIKNLSAAALLVDCVIVRISGGGAGQGTGVLNPYIPVPTDDPSNPLPKYGYFPAKDTDGVVTATIAAGGNAGLRIYTGTETQGADSAFVALHGSANTPANRGLVHVVLDTYQVTDGALPNFNFEVDTGVTALDTIVADLYGLVNVSAPSLDVTALSGLSLYADEGFIINSRDAAGRWLEDLKTCFQFDLPEVDGQAKAVLRGGSSVATITADELRAHAGGETPDDFEIEIADADPLALPQFVEVGYLDALNDYHTNVQPSRRLSGVYGDKQTVNLSMVLTADRARQLAETILYQRHQESRTFKIKVGPKYQKLHPCDVVTIQATNATHTARLTAQDWQLMLVQALELVRTQASVYTQTITGANSGYEPPVIQYPGNAKLLLLDIPLLRPEDAGDGTQPVVYCAACLIGSSGTFRGAYLYKERPAGSGSYKLETSFDAQATIGTVASGTAGTIDKTVWDRSTILTVDLYPASTLSGITEAQALNGPEQNLFAVGSMAAGWYIGQFTNASAGTPASPYQTRYTVSNILWDRFGGGAPPAGSLAGMDFVLLDSAVKPRSVELTDAGQPRKYRCPTSGQSVEDAQDVSLTLQANSLKPLAPSNVRGERDSAGSLVITWDRRARFAQGLRDYQDVPAGEETLNYLVEVYNGSTLLRSMPVAAGMSLAAILQGFNSGRAPNKFDSVTGNSFRTSGSIVADVTRAGSIQTIVQTGNFAEATLAVSGAASINFGLLDAAADWRSTTGTGGAYYFTLDNTSGSPVLAASANGVQIYSEDASAYYSTGARVRVTLSGSEVRFYRDYTGAGSPPLVVSEVAPSFPLRVYCRSFTLGGSWSASAQKVMMTDYTTPRTIYSAAQQTEDFGSTQSAIKVRVYQVSAIVGKGYYTEAIL